jgi:hypothetical protein
MRRRKFECNMSIHQDIRHFLWRPVFYAAEFFFIWFVRLLALRPLLASCASLGWYWRWFWRSRWNVDWQGKQKFSEKTSPSATFVHHKIPHDQTRVWTRAAAGDAAEFTNVLQQGKNISNSSLFSIFQKYEYSNKKWYICIKFHKLKKFSYW